MCNLFISQNISKFLVIKIIRKGKIQYRFLVVCVCGAGVFYNNFWYINTAIVLRDVYYERIWEAPVLPKTIF